jgi:hypothetical protein
MIEIKYLTESEIITAMRGHRYVLIKEWQRWGKCLTFKHKDRGDVCFLDNGRILEPSEMLQELKDNWEPATFHDAAWKIDKMEKEFMVLVDQSGETPPIAVPRSEGVDI